MGFFRTTCSLTLAFLVPLVGTASHGGPAGATELKAAVLARTLAPRDKPLMPPVLRMRRARAQTARLNRRGVDRAAPSPAPADGTRGAPMIPTNPIKRRKATAWVRAKGDAVSIDPSGDGLISFQLPPRWARAWKRARGTGAVGVTEGQMDTAIGAVVGAPRLGQTKARVVDGAVVITGPGEAKRRAARWQAAKDFGSFPNWGNTERW